MRAQRADELYELKNTDIFYDTSKTNFEERELHEYVRTYVEEKKSGNVLKHYYYY